MKKEEYLQLVDSLNLDKNEYCIISGGVMVMYNLREETQDVDLKITPKLFKNLKQSYTLTPSSKYDNLFELGEKIELKVEEIHFENVAWVDGYPVESLEKTLRWKLENNRPKDKEDIRKIQEYLGKH